MTRSALLLALSLPALALAQTGTKDAQTLPSLAPLVESVKAAVVNVDVQKREAGGGQGEIDEEMLERFFGGRRGRGRGGGEGGHIMQGAGSGFVIDPKGLVLTNNHVVDQALTLRVRFDDGRSFDAEVVGRDALVDVALLRLKGKVDNLPSVKLGDSGSMRVGDWVVAIGNPFGLASSVSSGIVSATERKIGAGPYDQFLQTDAAINPGNSGGPLFNLKGEVVGMNTAIFSNPGTMGGNIGIGFAVPSNLIKALVPQLEKEGAVTRGWLGVGIQDLTPELARAMGVPATDGALITSVNDGSPAKKAGMQEDDAVTAIDGEKVQSADVFRRVVALKRPDSVAALSVFRAGKPLELKVKLGTRPDLENVAGRGAAKSNGKDDPATKPSRLGLSFQDMDPRLSQSTGLPIAGALIVEVGVGSAAERAGLHRGMVVVEANKRTVAGRDDLVKAISDAKSGSVLLLRVVAPGGEGRSLRALELP